jgi:hypothetical protein
MALAEVGLEEWRSRKECMILTHHEIRPPSFSFGLEHTPAPNGLQHTPAPNGEGLGLPKALGVADPKGLAAPPAVPGAPKGLAGVAAAAGAALPLFTPAW